MREEEIQTLRKKAENAVADMVDDELKMKAFEVILSHLLAETKGPTSPASKRASAPSKKTEPPSTRTCIGRILLLKNEGFFVTQRTIAQVKEELARHGWHYPVTALSGKLQTLVRPPRRELRRLKAADGKRSVYKYSEP
jgi:hypothetical protein